MKNDHRSMNRRRFIETTGTAVAGLKVAGLKVAGLKVAGLTATQVCQGAERESPMVIDCHAHIYGEDEKKYPTIDKPYRPPAGKGTVAHLRREMEAAGVSRVTAIQTSSFYRWDNRFTADSARDNPDFMVGVVTLNPDDPKSPEQLEEYVRKYNVRGMRSIPAKSGKLDDPGVAKLWGAAQRLGIVINVLVNRDKRGEVETLVKRHPKLSVVIDHCLNLKAGDQLAATLGDLRALAEFPTVHAKLTFVPTGSAEAYPCQDMHDPCRAVINAFGPKRCVWGSDFPCELWCPKLTYAQHLRIFTHELRLDEATKKAVLSETARRLWFQARS